MMKGGSLSSGSGDTEVRAVLFSVPRNVMMSRRRAGAFLVLLTENR